MMSWQLIHQRLGRLRQRLAIPGYLLVGWSLAGQWSRTEFVFRKAKEAADSHWGGPILFVAGVLWLGWLIVKPAQNEGANRLERMKALLHEAAVEFRKSKEAARDMGDLAKAGYELLSLQWFLRDGFQHWVSNEYREFLEHEREVWKRADLEFHYSVVTADWLDELAGRISQRDVDLGFLLPDNYAQYRKTEKWQANRRPITA